MKIAIIGGGAAGLVTAYYLNKEFEVTIFERESILGGNIRTLNKNVKEDVGQIPDGLYVDNGVIEFDESNFIEFHALMAELGVEMERVSLTTAYFAKNGRHYLSPYRIFHTESNWSERIPAIGRLGFCVVDFSSFMLRTAMHDEEYYKDRSLAEFFRDHVYYRWLKMLMMYAYSIPYSEIDDMPAVLAIPVLRRCALFTRWTRIKNGVYTYVEKILAQFNGNVRTGVDITGVARSGDGVDITTSAGELEHFDKVVFATPPDQVLRLLSDPSEAEIRNFENWKGNVARTVIHTDTSMYDEYHVRSYSAFDVFEKENGDAGYNGFLNPLVGLEEDAPVRYNLAFNLEDRVDPAKVLHTQIHHTPLYTVDAFRYRDQVIAANGANHTYHAGAYLSDGLHEGAVRSAQAVARLLGCFSGEPQYVPERVTK